MDILTKKDYKEVEPINHNINCHTEGSKLDDNRTGAGVFIVKRTMLWQHYIATRTIWRHVTTDQALSLRSSELHKLRFGSPEAGHPQWHGWLHPVLRNRNRHGSELLTVLPSSIQHVGISMALPSALAGLSRSSNIAEGWHLGLKSLVQCTNPTLWTFLGSWRPQTGARTHWPDDCWPADACRNIVLSQYSVLIVFYQQQL